MPYSNIPSCNYTETWTKRKLYTLTAVVYKRNSPEDPLPCVLAGPDGDVINYSSEDQHVDSSATYWLLLGLKQRGFGTGRWNGFGGKVQSDDQSPRSAALRELHEESGLVLLEKHVDEVARLWFSFTDNQTCMEVHMFLCQNWSPKTECGKLCWPYNTEEMHPRWFPIQQMASDVSSFGIDDSFVCAFDLTHIPFENMWPDDRLWLPRVLSGQYILAWVHFTEVSSSKDSQHAMLADCANGTLGLDAVPYEMPAYKIQIFDRCEVSNGYSTDNLEASIPSNFLHSCVEKLSLQSDNSLKSWMREKHNCALPNSYVLSFG